MKEYLVYHYNDKFFYSEKEWPQKNSANDYDAFLNTQAAVLEDYFFINSLIFKNNPGVVLENRKFYTIRALEVQIMRIEKLGRYQTIARVFIGIDKEKIEFIKKAFQLYVGFKTTQELESFLDTAPFEIIPRR